MKDNITVLLTTCDRYETTLPLCLMSIFNQSYKPDKIVLVDDSVVKRFYEYSILKNILILLKEKNINFEYYYGPNKGMVPALQMGLNNIEDGWILKIDDDNILSYDVIEIFVKNIKPNIGAMGCIIIDKYLQSFYNKNSNKIPKEDNGFYNRIENIYSEFNIQMVHEQSDDIKNVEHIYSNYFFNRKYCDDYPKELQPSGHREDTIFTYSIFRKGYDLIIIPKTKIYHLYYDHTSGNRKWQNEYRKKSEYVFIDKLKEWGIIPDKMQIIEDDEKFYVIKNNTKYLVSLKK